MLVTEVGTGLFLFDFEGDDTNLISRSFVCCFLLGLGKIVSSRCASLCTLSACPQLPTLRLLQEARISV